MQSLSILHWLIFVIPFLLFAGAIFLFARAIGNRKPQERSAVTPGDGPSGFGGWLILLAIGVVFAPLYMVIRLVKDDFDIHTTVFWKDFSLAHDGDVTIHVVILLLQFFVLIFMIKRSKLFKPIYIWTSVYFILFLPIQYVWLARAVTWHEGTSFPYFLERMITPNTISDWIGMTIPSVIWMLYVVRSRRVANTFVR